MRILNIAENDWAGVSINLTEALKQHTKHEVRNLSMYEHIYKYPTDIVTRNPILIREWIDWADVVNCFAPLNVLNKKPKNLVVSYIGTHFREAPLLRYKQAFTIGAKKQLVYGPWMRNYADLGLEWLPAPIPVGDWLKLKRGHEGKPIVCQSVSLIKRIRGLYIKNEVLNNNNIILKTIRGVSWDKCMNAKAEADICIGPFYIGYGISLLEAMAMKIPVINHASLEEEIIEEVGYLPFYSCKLEELSNAIDLLLSDKKLYDKYAMLGFNYVKKFHDYPVVAKKFSAILERVFNG